MLVTPFIIIIGLVMGVILAAPTGPVNVICIQRTLQSGFWGGVAAGLGAVLGDGILAATAAFGIKAVSALFETHQMQMQIVGGIILIFFGGRLFFRAPVKIDPVEQVTRLSGNAGAIPQSFLLTVTNPGALLGILGLFSYLPSWIGRFDTFNAFILVLAVMAGSTAWWCGLAWLISIIRHQLNESRLVLINQIAAAVLVCFGMSLIGKMAWQFIL